MSKPNFLIIGAAKSGTTALYAYLRQHPDVYMPDLKEPNYFAFAGSPPVFTGPGEDNDINRFSVTQWSEYLNLFSDSERYSAVGEASHWYLYHEAAPERIRSALGVPKLIAILRNPIDRAFSEYMMYQRDNVETASSFRQAIELESERIEAGWGLAHYVQRGMYFQQLARYYEIFPRDAIRVYLYDDLKSDVGRVLKDIYEFLEIDPGFVANTSFRPQATGVPRSQLIDWLLTGRHGFKRKLAPLLPDAIRWRLIETRRKNLYKPAIQQEDRAYLAGLFREDVAKLSQLIGRDLSKWGIGAHS